MNVEEAVSAARFDADGLLPAIIQQHDTGEVLMLGYMDAEALRRTLAEGRVTFWSRSRQEYWRKGDTSGNRQYVKGPPSTATAIRCSSRSSSRAPPATRVRTAASMSPRWIPPSDSPRSRFRDHHDAPRVRRRPGRGPSGRAGAA
ncbi:hypothetical protein GCM10025869_30600 [Homoserinibacter gongjuensis]|uniref:phosphoribosyl-AMP cyclohydrolase n=1 Tax=Homoserinibacter gongjuensis TaxID=1162968 RepID=A0ABQ6JW60_9MICO|nr:hypothetical protein GCM10025869_30600 [Homoserinibacter gongjuensis]